MTRRQRRWLIVLVLIALLGALIVYSTRAQPVAVRVKTVEPGLVERSVANTRAGTVMACRRAKLSPSVGGQIARLNIKEGDTVKTGQLLLALWNKDVQAQIELTASETRAAQARAKASCAEAEVAQREAQRLLALKAKGVSSEEQTDRSVSVAKARQASCEATQASVRVSAAQQRQAQAALERTQLIAPFDGVIAQINGELNEFVTPSPVGVATPPAIDLIDNTCFYVSAPIDEVDAPAVQVGMPARISLDAFADKAFEGRVRRIDAFVLDREKQARTVDIEAEFVHPQDRARLLAGYSADVQIILQERQHVLRVPSEAVIEDTRVLVFSPENGELQERTFEAGIANWDFTEVLSGLHEGEQVVVSLDRAGVQKGARAQIETTPP